LKKENNNVSVVTVTYKDDSGLAATLESIAKTETHPCKVVVVDGAASVSTKEIVAKYNPLLKIELISEMDDGIYDAMNKGRKRVKTKLVQYLNGGDTVFGDPYQICDRPCLLPVMINDDCVDRWWFDVIKLRGYGYCHQGIVFPVDHPEYNYQFQLASDFDLICKTFPNGLAVLPTIETGYVKYGLGGISSRKSSEGDREIILSASLNLSVKKAIIIRLLIYSKRLIPRGVRRKILGYIMRNPDRLDEKVHYKNLRVKIPND
jgi:glycosyltransferase involved in cell wall biosynthesis